jgi:hypothetical protein
MKFIYVLINGNEWEDIIIFLLEEEAIQTSIKYSNSRIEIFSKSIHDVGYTPTYKYYKNGVLYNV